MIKKSYKQAILQFLTNHLDENISRDYLRKNIGISNSRLSEIIKEIRNDGYSLIVPARSGYIRLECNKKNKILEGIKDCDIRQWIIIFILSIYGPLTFKELFLKILQLKDYSFIDYNIRFNSNFIKAYDNNSIIKALRSYNNDNNKLNIDVSNEYIPITTLRKDLSKLHDLKIININTQKYTTYKLTNNAPIIITTSDDSLYELCLLYEEKNTSASNLSPVKNIIKEIKTQICYESYNQRHRLFGKLNFLSDTQLKAYNYFFVLPYKTNILKLEFDNTYSISQNTISFSVGLLYYSTETGTFYALGLNHNNEKYESIRLDYIKKVEVLNGENKIYHSKKLYLIYKEMFGAGYNDEVFHVKVLVQNFGNIISRFKSLTLIRSNSSLRALSNFPLNCKYTHIYEDDIRGLDDFARFLRSFGSSVIALEPIELKQKMVQSYNRLLDKYAKINIYE